MKTKTIASSTLLATTFLLIVCIPYIFALYESDVGTTDWLKENVGSVKHVVFPRNNDGRKDLRNPKLLFVATEQNVLAAIKLRTGAIAWRRAFTESIHSLKRISDDTVLTFSAECNAQLWDSNGGRIWQFKEENVNAISACDAVAIGQSVFILTSTSVQSVNARSGAVEWKYERDNTDLTFYSIINDNGLRIVALNYQNNAISGITTITLNQGTGSVQNTKKFSLSASVQQNGANIRVVQDQVIILSDNTLVSYKVGSDEQLTKEISDLRIESQSGDLVLLEDHRYIILNDLSTGSVYRISSGLTLDKTFTQGLTVSDSVVLDGSIYFAELTQSDDETKVAVFEAASGKQVHEFAFSRPQIQHGFIKRAYLHAYQNEDSSLGFRVLVVSEDEAITVAKKDKQVWTREEGLASIESSQFVNLPRKTNSKRSASENTYVNRLISQVEQFKSIGANMANLIPAIIQGPVAQLNKVEDSLFEDHFGFHKLILAKSKSGKIFAIHTNSGKIVWSIFVKALIPRKSGPTKDVITKAYVIRQQEAGEEDTSVVPEVAVLIKQSEDSKISTIIRLNGLDGNVIKAEDLSFSFKSAIVLPITESKTLYHPLLIIDSEMNVHVFPDKQRMRATIMRFPQQIYFYTADVSTNTLTGYTWSPKTTKATPVWSSKFEGKIETVSSNTSPRNEHIYSSVYIAGKNVLNKYLNPNLLAVSAVVETEGETDVHVYLLDSVTGHRVYHAVFENADGPVNTVVDDNVVLVQYMNTRPKRPQITSFELFINDTASQHSSFISSIAQRFSTQKQQTISSHELPSPIILQNTYILPYPARVIAPTKTSIGVTSKEFLLALANDQILELNKKTVDVRRPRGGPVSEEEGLLPYNPYIPYNPLSILTYNQTVLGIRSITTDPTLLESTTHVCAYGLDMFYRRIAPSKAFDSLHQEFSHLLLILTILALIVATFLARAYAAKKSLSQAWSN